MDLAIHYQRATANIAKYVVEGCGSVGGTVISQWCALCHRPQVFVERALLPHWLKGLLSLCLSGARRVSVRSETCVRVVCSHKITKHPL